MWQRIKNVYHLINAFLANLWFGFPSRNLTIIGVTGTDGKTTTVSLIYHILHSAGYNVSMISSVGAVIGGKNYDVGFHVTTPSPWALQRFISLCYPELGSGSKYPRGEMPKRVRHDNGNRYLVLETTSHALDQYRVFGIKFNIGVLTNVTHEHLDYHKTYENYVRTKARLLKMAKAVAVNKDDSSYKLVKSEIRSASWRTKSERTSDVQTNSKFKIQNSKLQVKNQKFITYGTKQNADINPKVFPFKTSLIGEFNKYNILAAVGACKVLGISDEAIRKGIETFAPPIGREEIVYKNIFTVMVDFAHTPNAFEQVLSSIRPNIKGRLIHVFGSAGERDSSKRPIMGKISAKYAGIIILTAEDPRSESVEKIMEEIVSGIQNSKFEIQKYNSKVKNKGDKNIIFKIADRKEAIKAAVKMARKGDFVLITGKAHERSMNYGKGEEPWDEFGTVKEALKNKLPPRRSPIGHLRGGEGIRPSTPRR